MDHKPKYKSQNIKVFRRIESDSLSENYLQNTQLAKDRCAGPKLVELNNKKAKEPQKTLA